MPIELGPLAADDSGDVRLQPGVERRLDAVGRVRADAASTRLDEVPGRERRLELREDQALVGRLARLFGRDRSGRLPSAAARRVAAREPTSGFGTD